MIKVACLDSTFSIVEKSPINQDPSRRKTGDLPPAEFAAQGGKTAGNAKGQSACCSLLDCGEPLPGHAAC